MNKELLIKKDLNLGLSWDKISNKYKVGKSTIKKIVEQGRYYLDIITGEIIFTSKKISKEEQQYNYLCYMNDITDGDTFSKQKNSLISKRAINPRLAVYIGVDSRQTNRWSKKEKRLFGCDENGKADSELDMFGYSFMILEESTFSNKSYHIDKKGMVKGYKLWYVEVSRKWLYYIKNYIYSYIKWIKVNKDKDVNEFYEYANKIYHEDEYCYINARVSVEYGKWLIKQLNKYSFDYIKKAIDLNTKAEWDMTDEDYNELNKLDINIPTIFYLEKDAYYTNLLSSEYKEMVSKYIY